MARRLTEAQVKDRAEPEALLRTNSNELAAMLGWTFMYVIPLRTRHGWRTPTYGPLGEGWPDTTYFHPTWRRTVYVEFKSETGQASPAQLHCHAVLRASGCTVLIIRPSTFDELAAELQRRAA